MSAVKEPCSVSRSVKLSNGKYNVSETEMFEVKGGVLKDCKCVWTACKAELRLFRTTLGNKITTWRFGSDILSCDGPAELGPESLIDTTPHVTCVCELPPRGAITNSTSPQLLVGLDCGPGRGGVVCICDSSSGSIVTSVKVAKPVSALTVVNGGASAASRLLSRSITDMCGVAAVGLMNCGYIMLIDLRRHDPDGVHNVIFLNEASYTVSRKFALKGSDGKVRCYLPSFKVDVTCIQYIPCITSLLVGYNFGCFEIWDLREMKIRYVSPVMEQTIPVAHIAFQEPSDDPRNYCYIWAVHSNNEEVSENSSDSCHPVAFMYALCYQWKEWVDGCGYIYEGFKGCSQQFFFEMKSYENIETIGSSSLTCQAVGTSLSRQRRSLGPDDFDDSVIEGELSLCLFAWQSIDTDCKSKLRVALFDLDRWYKEEMPNSGNGSYIVVFHLEEVLSSRTCSVLDVVVEESSLQPYRSDTGHEEYYRPSALSFVSRVLFVDELVELNHPGEQQYLLSCLDKSGPLALLHPTHIYKECLNIGLRPAFFDVVSPSSDLALDKQRRFLLALALEWQMSGFLHSCAVEWASGSQSVAGCSLPLLLSWGWEFALIVKEEAHKLCAPLFDNSGTKLDRAGRRMLSMYRNQLVHLAKLFKGVLYSPKIPKMYVPENVEKRATGLEMISLYFELVQWFMNAGLLPEFPDISVTNEGEFFIEEHHKLLPYPASAIKKFYEDRRAELGNKLPLFVDLLLEQDKSQQLKTLWIDDGGNGCYPPPSLQALLRTYLIDILDATAKHCLVIYLFLDIADTLDERYAGAVNYLIKFPASVYMRPSVIKITQAMWLLDHKDFEEALRMLLDSMIQPSDMEQWQHRSIALAFLKQGKANLALDYIVCRNVPLETLDDIRLKISILIENKKVLEAYECQNMYSVGRSDQNLMEYFVSELVRTELLDQIFFLTLTPNEEKCFLRRMEKYPINISGSTALIYFLLQSRKIEAYWLADRVERKYNESYFSEEHRTMPHKYVSKSAEGLPEIERKIAALFENKSPVSKPGTIPEPLSMTVNRHGSLDPAWFSSTGLETILRKTKETWLSDIVIDAESTVQKTPFLFAPHHLQMNRTINSARAVCVSDKKRRRGNDADSETPQKRRCLDVYVRTLNRSANKEVEFQEEVNVSTLLDTPRIRRLSELKMAGRDSLCTTPPKEHLRQQSILKAHSTPVKSLSPVNSSHEEPISQVSKQASFLDHMRDRLSTQKIPDEKNEQDSGRLSASRQIRFELPKESKEKSVVGASPRRALSQIREASSKNSLPKRPLCFFPKLPNANFERDDPPHQTNRHHIKEGHSSSYLTSYQNENRNESGERSKNREASIKGKYFFPPKTIADDISDDNQDDSFVSASSDVDFNAENIENAKNRNVSPSILSLASKDLNLHTTQSKVPASILSSRSRDLNQLTSTPRDLDEPYNLKNEIESKLEYQVSKSVDSDRSVFRSSLLKQEVSMSLKKDSFSATRSKVSDSTEILSPSPSHITSRITKRKSYRTTNVSLLSENITHEIHNEIKFKNILTDKMPDNILEIGSDTNRGSTLRPEKLATSLRETNSEIAAEGMVSVEKSAEKIGLSLRHDNACCESTNISRNKTQSNNEVVPEEIGSTLSPEKLATLLMDTEKEIADGGEFSIEKPIQKTLPLLTLQGISYDSTNITVNNIESNDEVGPAINVEKNGENSTLNLDNVCSSEKSDDSLLNLTSDKEVNTNIAAKKCSSGSAISYLPENTMYISSGDSVCSEQSDMHTYSSNNITLSNINETLIMETSSSCDDSVDRSVGFSNDTENNTSTPAKKPLSKHPQSFLPDNTFYSSPEDTFNTKKPDDKLISPDVKENEGNFTLSVEASLEKSSTSLVVVNAEKKEKERNFSIPAFLPDDTILISPSENKVEQRSLGNTEKYENNITDCVRDSSSSPEPSTSSYCYRELNKMIDSCYKSKISSKSFLPDTTVCWRPSDTIRKNIYNKEKCADDAKTDETAVCMTTREIIEVLPTALIDKETDVSATLIQTELPFKKQIQSFLPDETKYDSHGASDDEVNSEGKAQETGVKDNLHYQMEDVTESHTNTICKEIYDKKKSADDAKTDETNVCIDTKVILGVLPAALIDNKTESDVSATDIETELLLRKQTQSFLPDEAKYGSDDENDDQVNSEGKIQEYHMKDVTNTHIAPGSSKSALHVNSDGTTAGQSQAGPEEKEEACCEADFRNDDTDEEWHASAEDVASEEERDEEGTYPDEADDSSSSTHSSFATDSEPSSSESYYRRLAEVVQNKVNKYCTEAIFDPCVDPESDTEEEVAALSASHGNEVTDNENKSALSVNEETSGGMETHNVPPAGNENATNHTGDVTSPVAESDKDPYTGDVKDGQSARINSELSGSTQSLWDLEIQSAAKHGNITSPEESIITEKIKSGRPAARCRSEPPNSEYNLRKQRLKKTPSTNSIPGVASSFSKNQHLQSKADISDAATKELDISFESSPAETERESNRSQVAKSSPIFIKTHSSNELPELPHDIHKSIQEWMNSPVVTRAGFRRLSSIQSEPPQMDDVADVGSRDRTRHKKTSSVVIESSFWEKSASESTQLHQELSTSQTANSVTQNAERDHQMEQYATARRLTRYQRSLLAKSADITAAREIHPRQRMRHTTPSPSKSAGTSRHSSPDHQLVPSPGDADDISVAHSEESDMASSVTTGSLIQHSPKSARSENVTKPSSHRNLCSVSLSPTSIKSLPVAPTKRSSQRGVRNRIAAQKLKGGERGTEESQTDHAFSPPVRRTQSHSDLSDAETKPSKRKPHSSSKSVSKVKENLRVTRSQAKQQSTLQPIPEESGSSSVDNQLTDTSKTDQRKRRHSRSPADSKKVEPTRISTRKAMKLRSHLSR